MEDVVKQIIVVRRDLLEEYDGPMGPGKLAVQVAHASMGAFLKQCHHHGISKSLDLIEYPHTREWLEGPFRKIVLYVKSEEKLLNEYNKLKNAGILVSLITDAGYTVFEEPTVTCFGVEPLPSSKIDPLTKRLQLLN
jgi:peptidyl-tRNA hydrolase